MLSTKSIAGIVLAALVVACAAPQTVWLLNGKTAAQLASDQDQCQAEAGRMVLRPPVHESKVELTGLANLINIFEEKNRGREHAAALRAFADDCMRAKGWASR